MCLKAIMGLAIFEILPVTDWRPIRGRVPASREVNAHPVTPIRVKPPINTSWKHKLPSLLNPLSSLYFTLLYLRFQEGEKKKKARNCLSEAVLHH